MVIVKKLPPNYVEADPILYTRIHAYVIIAVVLIGFSLHDEFYFKVSYKLHYVESFIFYALQHALFILFV